MSATDNKYRVWIGCLGCYNNGHNPGAWFDADEIVTEVSDWEQAVGTLPAVHTEEGHEELWVFDHENSPCVDECSPGQAQEYATLLEATDYQMSAPLAAFIDERGGLTEATMTEFQKSYKGQFEELADVLEDQYPRTDLPDWADGHYWEILRNKARDLAHEGWWAIPAEGGGVHVFS